MDVIKARLDEIFDKLKKQLIVPGFDMSSGLSFLLVGGGFNISNIEKYFINFFGTNVKKADKNMTEKGEELKKNFDSCLGAVKIIKDGWETEAIPEISSQNIKKIGFFAKIFGFDK